MTELIILSLAKNSVGEAADEPTPLRKYLDDIEVDNHNDPLFRGCMEATEAASLRRYLDDIDVGNHSDPLFRGCIKAVELGQSVKVRMGENPAKYDEIKKRLERHHKRGPGREKDISVPLFLEE
jgi:hypothetical protein